MIKKLNKKIDSIKGIDVGKTINKVFRVKPHKKLKNHYYTKLHPHIQREASKTKDLFVEQYKYEYTAKFIALVFIVAVIGMSVFAIMPSLNPGVIIDNSNIPECFVPTKTLQQTEVFSPEPVLSNVSFILAIVIIITISWLSLRKKNE